MDLIEENTKDGDRANKNGHGRDQKLQTGLHQEARVFKEFRVWMDGMC